MKVKTRILLCLFCFWAGGTSGRTTTVQAACGDSIRISLLTCAAGEEIYSLFGHTAIRCENLTKGTDVVYNYGVFDFDAPNFVLRFALGKTDYQLARNTYAHFAASYAFDGRDVWQQTLNLQQAEKERLVELLELNYRPENRVYRYNFFYDNCATRPRDQIERAVAGRVQYADDMDATDTGVTFRHLLHRYSEGHPWSRFGMDMCMGSEADKPISRRVMQFVPFYLQDTFRQAVIADADAGTLRPLVTGEATVVRTGATDGHPEDEGITPLQCALLLWAAVTAATLYGLRKGKTLWGIDAALFGCAGIAGCIPAFLVLFSQHPAVCPNFLLFVLHPLHLCCLPWVLQRVRKRRTSRYLTANLAVLILFIILWGVIPQHFPPAMLFVALCLLERSVSNIVLSRLRPSRTVASTGKRRTST